MADPDPLVAEPEIADEHDRTRRCGHPRKHYTWCQAPVSSDQRCLTEQSLRLGEEIRVRLDAVLGAERERLRPERGLERDVDGRLAGVVLHEVGELAHD